MDIPAVQFTVQIPMGWFSQTPLHHQHIYLPFPATQVVVFAVKQDSALHLVDSRIVHDFQFCTIVTEIEATNVKDTAKILGNTEIFYVTLVDVAIRSFIALQSDT